MEDTMGFFRKDGSLDTILAGMFYPPIAQIDKMCKIILSYGGQFHKKQDGGVKFYLLEESDAELEKQNGRLFLIPEKILEFDPNPKVFVEGAEHVDFTNGKKEMAHIFADKMGNPLMSFFIPHEQKKEKAHALFSFKDGYELIVFVEKEKVEIQIVDIRCRLLSSGKYALYENPIYQGLLATTLPRKFWKLERAFAAAKEKFFCKDCIHPHFYKKYRARP